MSGKSIKTIRKQVKKNTVNIAMQTNKIMATYYNNMPLSKRIKMAINLILKRFK